MPVLRLNFHGHITFAVPVLCQQLLFFWGGGRRCIKADEPEGCHVQKTLVLYLE
jgi:hypothetical protein